MGQGQQNRQDDADGRTSSDKDKTKTPIINTHHFMRHSAMPHASIAMKRVSLRIRAGEVNQERIDGDEKAREIASETREPSAGEMQMARMVLVSRIACARRTARISAPHGTDRQVDIPGVR